jgi:ribonucleoside-diphosphate reductase alpha chain
MHNNDGYIKVTAIMQKFFDQAISGNWSYNPENYPNNEVPMQQMAMDWLNTYKYGWKTSYYQNTYDAKKDGDVEESLPTENLINDILTLEEEDCESCKI